jgi:hypothetical protein
VTIKPRSLHAADIILHKKNSPRSLSEKGTAGARLDIQPHTDERRDYGNGGDAEERYVLIKSNSGGTDRAIDQICKCEKISFLRGDDGTVFKDDPKLRKELADRETKAKKPQSDQKPRNNEAPRPRRDLPDENNLKAGEITEYHYVPDRLVGLVIGTQGETISGIQKLTRTSINCAKYCEPGKSERRIEISGNPENIEEAKNRIKAICDEVGDKPKKSELKAMQRGLPLPVDYQDQHVLVRLRKIIDYAEL